MSIAIKEANCGFWEKNIYKTDIAFTTLRSNAEITKQVKFDKTKFEIKVKLRQALDKKEMRQVSETSVELEEILESFDTFKARKIAENPRRPSTTSTQQSHHEPERENVQQSMIKIAKEVQEQNPTSELPKVNKPAPAQPVAAAAAAGGPVPIPEDLKAEIVDPENTTMLRSVAYCTHRIQEIDKQFEEAMSKGVRVDRKLRDLLKTLHSQKTLIEQGCGTGAISPQEYLAMLKEMLQKDQQLAKYFKSVSNVPANQAKLKICIARFKVVKQEAAEIEQALKQ